METGKRIEIEEKELTMAYWNFLQIFQYLETFATVYIKKETDQENNKSNQADKK